MIMKRFDTLTTSRHLVFFTMLLVLIPGVAMASSSPDWRPRYDQIMMYVNFTILAAIIYKYGKDPIKAFLKQQKKDVVEEIDTLEEEKKRISDEIENVRAQSEDNKQRLEKMKERLIIQGKAKKKQIIDQAQQQSAMMIEDSRKKMENRILQAKNQIKLELADLAFEQAKQQLPQIINEDDNQRLLDLYMRSLEKK
jgi:F-type H+-transporting ATPase subunit b